MKKIIPAVVIIVLMAIVGYFLFMKKGGVPKEPGTPKTQQKGSNVISSIKEAITKSLPIKCEYPDEKGNTITSYIKGEKIRVVGYKTEEGNQGNTLITGDKMYVWDDQTKKGTIISLNKEATMVTGVPAESEETADQKAQTIENIEKYKEYCQVTVISDTIFKIPGDVQFTDLDQQMKDAGVDVQKMMEQYKISPSSAEEE